MLGFPHVGDTNAEIRGCVFPSLTNSPDVVGASIVQAGWRTLIFVTGCRNAVAAEEMSPRLAVAGICFCAAAGS